MPGDEHTENLHNTHDLRGELSSPEAKAEMERLKKENLKLADDIINNSFSNLKDNITLSYLRADSNLYKQYAETIQTYPEYQKYLQIYNYKGKKFLVIPVYDQQEKKFMIKTVEIAQKDWNTKIIWNSNYSWENEYHHYALNPNVIAVKFDDKDSDLWYRSISMNKWTWEILDVDPHNYKQDEKWINALIETIGENANWTIDNCSEWLQSNVKNILSQEDELKKESNKISDQKYNLIQDLMQWNFSWAVSKFIDIVKSFFKRKKNWRIINIWKWINYEGDEKDVNYLESAINTVLDPEQRSKLTYLLSKIKDKHTKEWLKEKWMENPSQFDLLMQQLQPWQIMLTNALDLEWQSWIFKFATQAVSWSRWCHALIISDVIKDSNGIITDAKIIQSTLKWWVHETTLKKYIKENYSSSDFLLANTPKEKREDIISNAKSQIWQKYDRVSIVTDSIVWIDVDKWTSQTNWSFLDKARSNFLWKNKAYCSELVFDAIDKSGLKMPQPHMSPSDLLMTDEITPQYACYCNKL